MRQIWRNGLFLPESEAVVSIYDEGMMYGTTVFEMMRSFNKDLFKVEEHVTRLFQSCKATYMPITFNETEIKHGQEDIVYANKREFAEDDEYRTLINVSRGTVPIYKDIVDPAPWVMITVFPLKWVLKGISKYYTNGVSAYIPSQRTTPACYIDPKVKNRSRLHYKLAELEVRRTDPGAWPLLLDQDGFVAESSGSNFFMVKDGVILTPEPRNILRGISREYVIGLTQDLDLSVKVQNLESYDVLNADEAFFTATPFCIMPITKINGVHIGDGWVGGVTRLLMETWCDKVNCDFVEQAERWDANSSQPN